MAARLRILTLPLFLVVLVGAISMLRGCDEESSQTFAVKLGNEWFTLETALSKADQQQGLMFREVIADDGGMIFVFDNDEQRSFWMKNCLVDIDIIYVDRTGRIISTYTMQAQPPQGESESDFAYENRIRADASYPSGSRSRYVIELRAGRIAELGLEKDQKLDLDLKRLKELAG